MEHANGFNCKQQHKITWKHVCFTLISVIISLTVGIADLAIRVGASIFISVWIFCIAPSVAGYVRVLESLSNRPGYSLIDTYNYVSQCCEWSNFIQIGLTPLILCLGWRIVTSRSGTLLPPWSSVYDAVFEKLQHETGDGTKGNLSGESDYSTTPVI